MEIVQELKRAGDCRGRYGPVINEIKFQSWNVCHVKRVCNNAAQGVAKFALTLYVDQLWRDAYPSCIQDIVLAEKQSI